MPKSANRSKALGTYQAILWFPDDEKPYLKLGLPRLQDKLQAVTRKHLGCDLPLEVVSDGSYSLEKKGPKEILFGRQFRRPGIPDTDPAKSCYGVTADGTVYFHSPSILFFVTLWDRFLEEFSAPSASLKECFREIPSFSHDDLRKAGYRPVFEDTFDGDRLDPEVWHLRRPGSNGKSAQAPSQYRVENGKLILTGEYREEGEYGPGWYTADLALLKRYGRGYFEATIRCSLNLGRRAGDFWSAFWIQGPSPYSAEKSRCGVGPGGAELDILENFGPDYQTSCFWCAGVDGKDDLYGELYQVMGAGADYSGEYHTYGLLWDEKEYRLYLDGMLYACTEFVCGTSPAEEEVCVSLCASDPILVDRSVKREMFVDSVRIWQKPSEN